MRPLADPDAALAHLTPSSVMMPVCRCLETAPPSSRPGWKPILADWSLVSSTTAIRHGEISLSDLTSASLTPQSPEMSSLLIAPRQPVASSKLTRPAAMVLRAITCIFGSSVARTDRPPS